MKKILCIHPGVAYLPEIEGYKKYFIRYDIKFIDCIKDLNNNYDENNYDLLWYMMGTDFKKIDKPKVHDYASLSTGKYVFFKDKVKKYINQKPNLRLFLNKNIRDAYNFNDNVPYLIRDMGVDKSFFIRNEKKEYDFVYVGAITKERKIPELLKKFTNELKSKTLLVIGAVPDDIYYEFNKVSNITFIGKIEYYDVSKYASKAIYGINMIPDMYPFNIQASTKLLEYCALGLKVVTTNYEWVKKFESNYKGNFFHIDENLNNFDIKEIEKFNYIIPSVANLKWNKILDRIMPKIQECL